MVHTKVYFMASLNVASHSLTSYYTKAHIIYGQVQNRIEAKYLQYLKLRDVIITDSACTYYSDYTHTHTHTNTYAKCAERNQENISERLSNSWPRTCRGHTQSEKKTQRLRSDFRWSMCAFLYTSPLLQRVCFSKENTSSIQFSRMQSNRIETFVRSQQIRLV